ncbi:hypothetical protein AA11826_0683 [Komagataeibacter oboediens DSM 11826]|uniref:hypothetical protein n=1 Tax=Komagataeibacter oboediens TaxID=65958 RepID=UPI002156B496|nr:hypothetical protein [Komagataeibacter oboediens]GBR30717.1 hypothetical protein AA11826_0683 [Komagataeibacter oboediens DSM 11826]
MNAKTEQLTYRQIADRLGLSVDAARARVRRGGWLKITDNSGTVRVSVPAHALTNPNMQGEQTPEQSEMTATDGVNAELMNTLRLAVTTLQRELDRRAEEAAQDKEELSRLRDDNADLRARLAVAEARLTEREYPTDGVNVGGEQAPDVQVNAQGERPPRTWWQRLFSV